MEDVAVLQSSVSQSEWRVWERGAGSSLILKKAVLYLNPVEIPCEHPPHSPAVAPV